MVNVEALTAEAPILASARNTRCGHVTSQDH